MHDFEPSTIHLIFSYATEVKNQLFKDLLNGYVVLSSHLYKKHVSARVANFFTFSLCFQ